MDAQIVQFVKHEKELDEEEEREVEKLFRKITFKEQAERAAEQEFYLKKERMKIQLELNTNIPEEEYKEMEKFQNLLKEKKKSNLPNYCGFVTVNPEKNHLEDFEQLDKRVKKCLSKVWVTDYAYCYEQRSTDENDIHGLHCHILLIRGIKPKHFEREIRSSFKAIVRNDQLHVNIQYKRKEWIPDKLEYMKGLKTGDGKDLKIPVDKIMREKLGIEDMYYSENLIS